MKITLFVTLLFLGFNFTEAQGNEQDMNSLSIFSEYAKAKNIYINLSKSNDNIHFFYKDDGIGFTQDGFQDKFKGLGMSNIKNRIDCRNSFTAFLNHDMSYGTVGAPQYINNKNPYLT